MASRNGWTSLSEEALDSQNRYSTAKAGRGHWTINYTGAQLFISFASLGNYINSLSIVLPIKISEITTYF